MLRSRAVTYARDTPYLHVIELLKSYLRSQERDDSREIRERVADKLLTFDRTLEPLVMPLLALFDVPIDEAAWDTLDPPYSSGLREKAAMYRAGHALPSVIRTCHRCPPDSAKTEWHVSTEICYW